MENFDDWMKEVEAWAGAHDILEIFNPRYIPDPTDVLECDNFRQKQAFFYATLRSIVKCPELFDIVEKHSPTRDAQLVLTEITHFAKTSAYAMIANRDMMINLTTARLNPKTWTKSFYAWIVYMDSSMVVFNRRQVRIEMRINDYSKRMMMQNSVSPIKAFREVNDQETDRMIMGGDAFTYAEYLVSIKSVATRLDETRPNKNNRDVNRHIFGEEEETDVDAQGTGYDINEIHKKSNKSSSDMDPKDIEYLINEIRRKGFKPSSKPFSAKMNLETWKSLSPEAQKIWDQLDDDSKAKILGYSDDRKQRRSANIHETNDTSEEEQDDEATSVEDETPKINVNTAISRARAEAHPADPRRMMGSDDSGTQKDIRAMMHRLSWNEESSDEEDSYWGAQDFY